MITGLLVVSYSDPASFNHALADAVAATWESLGIATTLIDLHVIVFDPILSAAEARGRPAADQTAIQQIDLLRGSDLLAVVHPNQWGAPPALMKGWMDRVFCARRGPRPFRRAETRAMCRVACLVEGERWF